MSTFRLLAARDFHWTEVRVWHSEQGHPLSYENLSFSGNLLILSVDRPLVRSWEASVRLPCPHVPLPWVCSPDGYSVCVPS